jgi:hypothetical protein
VPLVSVMAANTVGRGILVLLRHYARDLLGQHQAQ